MLISGDPRKTGNFNSFMTPVRPVDNIDIMKKSIQMS